jgi:cysteine-rich repeat protein
MHRSRSLLVLALASGCVGNFDAHLYQAREEAGTSDAGTPNDAGIAPLALGDFCGTGGSVPMIPRPASPTDAVSTAFLIDTTGLADDVSDVAACTGAQQHGNDGFASVMMMAGERWHFHLRRPSGGMNAALYILDSACDERTCAGGAGQDLCGASADEHFSYTAPADGTYYLGVDAEAAGGFTGELDVIHPVCGDHTKQHSEGCDDGNTMGGDGCDAQCRVELSSGGSEMEANDDRYSANHVILGASGTAVNVIAHVASACESDVFAFDVPTGETAAVVVAIDLSTGGCPADATVPMELALLGTDGSTALATTTLPSTGGCPMLMGGALGTLASGTYFVRVRSIGNTAPDRPFDYRVTITPTFTP